MELARSTRSVEKDANSNHTTRNSGTGFSTGRGRRGNTIIEGQRSMRAVSLLVVITGVRERLFNRAGLRSVVVVDMKLGEL